MWKRQKSDENDQNENERKWMNEKVRQWDDKQGTCGRAKVKEREKQLESR